MKKHKGFTLVELMIALTVLGVLTALVLPMLNNNTPSRNRMMMKKAYYTIEDVVRELVNNERYYPTIGASGTYAGFDNLENTCSGISDLNNSCEKLQKFAKLFAHQLNVKGDVTPIASGVMFQTSDGLYWQITGRWSAPVEVRTAGGTGITQEILVDVNGTKGPNSLQGSGLASADRAAGGGSASVGSFGLKDYDRFKVFVTKEGKIIPRSGQRWFEDAISVDSSVNGD